MTIDTNEQDGSVRSARMNREIVALSKWVNEKSPALGEILSAHEIAHLTRRPRWLLHTLAVIGKFPRQQRFHDRAIGWAKEDVLQWLAENVTFKQRTARRLRAHLHQPRQERVPCSKRRRSGAP